MTVPSSRPVRRALTCHARVMSALAFLVTLGGSLPGARLPGRGWHPVVSAAQARATGELPESTSTFRGTRESSRYWITELRYGRRLDAPKLGQGSQQLSLSVGQMWRVGSRWSTGGALFFQTGDADRWGADGRFRYWLGSETHLEGAAGVWFEDSPPVTSRGVGTLLRTELGFGDTIGLWTELAVRNLGSTSVSEWRYGVSADSYAGLAGGAVLTVLVVLYALAVGSVIQ